MSDKPIFKLAPVEHDQTKRVLSARRDVLCNADLDYGARCLWCLLTDSSYLETMHERTGVIAFSKSQLSGLLKCSPRAIVNWREQLRKAGYLWTTDKAIPNAWPITVWHVSVLDPEPVTRLTAQTTAGGLLNGGQSVHPRQRNEKRSESGKFCPAQGQSLPTARAKFAPGKGKVCTSHGQQVAHAKGKVCTSHGQKTTLAVGKVCTSHGQQVAHLKETPYGEKETMRGAEAPPNGEKVGKVGEDIEFAKWTARVCKYFPPELEKLEKALQSQLLGASGASIGLIRRKIAAVRAALYGPGTPEPAAAKPKPARPPAQPPTPLTPEEIKAGAEYLASIGKADGPAAKAVQEALR